jgi:transposase-like protein
MGLSRRKFTREFKLSAIRRLETGVPIAELARAIEVHPGILRRWQKEHLRDAGNAFSGAGKARGPEGRIAELERKVEQQILEIDFLKECLQMEE